MHIAASLLTMMARPSCTTVRLFGASHCHVLPLHPACTVVVQSPRGWWGTVFPGVGNDKGGGYGVYLPPPLLYKLRPCASDSRRRDRINLGPNFNSVPNIVQYIRHGLLVT